MTNSMKKLFPMMVLTLILALVMAIPAFAATEHSYSFWKVSPSEESHASEYILGDAVVDGTQITITLEGDYYDYLKVGPSDVYAVQGDDGNGNTTFTFTGSTASDIPVKLFIEITYPGGSHSAEYPLILKWS
ncbi:hypothetical protein BK133_04385 [Paenibacillus sp. FSL H8-0548]|uniref:hypothetical protein n=1 Tax=Paenibacillus sp. FSL H8-0548 TaxID=1920422 RepID=UPI00096DAC2E|nr:hypothetical protein [Paenibacillus sp. FSL H8-0548]OMF37776.1 hypothetical protein BK133_04385 [Paenibacillus sp. FSL H8-0548]